MCLTHSESGQPCGFEPCVAYERLEAENEALRQERDAVAAWNALPRKQKWTIHNHKDKSTWPPRDQVVLVDRRDGMRWPGEE